RRREDRTHDERNAQAGRLHDGRALSHRRWANATIEFLAEALDAVELRRFPDDKGRIVHAEVRIGDTVVMIADSAPSWPPVPAHVHVYVPDVDATYRRAL